MKYLYLFTALYLIAGSWFFIGSGNFEFIIYVAVIVAIFSGVLWLHKHVKFPVWMLTLLSVWGLMHVAGGAVPTSDGVLFAYRIYPFLDWGGEFYILKFDQVVHGYLYGVVAIMSHYILQQYMKVWPFPKLTFSFAMLASVGVSALNEIMEFIISLTMENGVGGYDNTMLDICFNLAGALIATTLYLLFRKK